MAAAVELEREGVTFLRGLLSAEQVQQARNALDRLFAHGLFGKIGGDKGNLIMHTPNLTARDQVFRDVVQLPQLVEVLSHVLGDDYILADMVSLTPAPGNDPQPLHRDAGHPRMSQVCMVNCMVALTEFDETNGATRWIKGSHLKTDFLPQELGGEEGLFIATPGDAMLWDNRVVHGREFDSAPTCRPDTVQCCVELCRVSLHECFSHHNVLGRGQAGQTSPTNHATAFLFFIAALGLNHCRTTRDLFHRSWLLRVHHSCGACGVSSHSCLLRIGAYRSRSIRGRT